MDQPKPTHTPPPQLDPVAPLRFARQTPAPLSPAWGDGSAADEQMLDALDRAGLSTLEAWARAPEALRDTARRIVFDGANPRDLVELLSLLWFPDVEQIAREQESLEHGESEWTTPDFRPRWLRPYFLAAPPFRPERSRCLMVNPSSFLYQLPARLWLHFSPRSWTAALSASPAPASARMANAQEFAMVAAFLNAFLAELES